MQSGCEGEGSQPWTSCCFNNSWGCPDDGSEADISDSDAASEVVESRARDFAHDAALAAGFHAEVLFGFADADVVSGLPVIPAADAEETHCEAESASVLPPEAVSSTSTTPQTSPHKVSGSSAADSPPQPEPPLEPGKSDTDSDSESTSSSSCSSSGSDSSVQ